MRIAPFAVAIAVVQSLAVAGPTPATAADRLIPFAVDVDIEPQGQYVAAGFIDTSSCERFAVFISGSGATGHPRLSLRIGIPDGETIVRAGTMGGTVVPNGSDETGALFLWQGSGELIAPRVQPVLYNSHGAATLHVNKAWLYCKTPTALRR